MSGARRRLVLHAGMPKTGSSALQVAFVRNEAVLEELGVFYPVSRSTKRAAKGRVTTGNAGLLAPYLRGEPSEAPGNGVGLVDRALDETDRPTVLFSSELFFFADPDRLSELNRHVERAGSDLSVALYVRDFIPWVLSTFAQHVQTGGYAGDLGEFIDQFEREIVRVQARLRSFVDVLGHANVTLMHYDTHRLDLAQHFFHVVLGGAAGAAAPQAPGAVNRTLSARELAWMRLVNRRVGSQSRSMLVGNALVRQPPLDDAASRAGLRNAARIEELAAPQVAWINDTFFDGKPVVQAGADQGAGDQEPVEISELEAHLLAVCADITRRLPSELGSDAEKAKLREQLLDERRRRRAAERKVQRLRAELSESSPSPAEANPAGRSLASWWRRASRPRG